jgi:hypothetical protein
MPEFDGSGRASRRTRTSGGSDPSFRRNARSSRVSGHVTSAFLLAPPWYCSTTSVWAVQVILLAPRSCTLRFIVSLGMSDCRQAGSGQTCPPRAATLISRVSLQYSQRPSFFQVRDDRGSQCQWPPAVGALHDNGPAGEIALDDFGDLHGGFPC